MDVLRSALEAARQKNISTLVVASTSGRTAVELWELVKQAGLSLIVVTHDEGKPDAQRRFNPEIRRKLETANVMIYTHNPRAIFLRKLIAKFLGPFGFPRWYRHLRAVKDQYGTGIKVCHIIVKMLLDGKILNQGRLIAIAGAKSGADSVALFSIRSPKQWPLLEEIIMSPQP